MIKFEKFKMVLVGDDGKTVRSTSMSRNKVGQIYCWEEFMDEFLEDKELL